MFTGILAARLQGTPNLKKIYLLSAFENLERFQGLKLGC